MSAVIQSLPVASSPLIAPASVRSRAPRYAVRLARDAADVEAAQRLRHRVFAGEMGAHLDARDGRDVDRFDDWCEHLLVTEGEGGTVVGTYRILMPQAARRLGGLYSDGEFSLERLAPVRDRIIELGRSCVHPDHRSGAVILLLWGALADLVAQVPDALVIGCVSVPMRDGGTYAANLWRQLAPQHLAEASLRVTPLERLPLERYPLVPDVEVPPLVRGYLRMRARIIGEPHCDVAFGVADIPMMLPVERLGGRYARRVAVAEAA